MTPYRALWRRQGRYGESVYESIWVLSAPRTSGFVDAWMWRAAGTFPVPVAELVGLEEIARQCA